MGIVHSSLQNQECDSLMFHDQKMRPSPASERPLLDMIEYEMHVHELQLDEVKQKRRHYLIGSLVGTLFATWAYLVEFDVVAYGAIALNVMLLWRCQVAATEASIIEHNQYARECHLHERGYSIEYFKHSLGQRVKITRLGRA